MSFCFRLEQPGDGPAVAALLEAAFPTPAEATLVEQLRASGDIAISLVALEGEALVGYVAFSVLRAPLRALGLAPVAVSFGLHGKGIGSQLIRAGLDLAAEQGWQVVFTLGEPVYYQRFGFSTELASGFVSPYAGPYFMALALGESLELMRGEVDYAPAFAELG